MAIINGTQFLERIQFFNGQRLFAPDLQALEAFNREMRWLHNQSLHQPGVGSGYAVTGNKGDRQVTITPGYALDSFGREIILTETHVEPVPPVADNGAGKSVFYDLTVSYPDDTDLKESETRDGICLPRGVVRLREEPVFCWVRLGDDANNRQPVDMKLKDRIQKGLFIVLARAEVFNCQLKQPVSVAQRRNARPPKQPHIACGMVPANLSPPPGRGSSIDYNSSFDILSVKFTARIDTSSAAFAATPCYLARLVGERDRTDQGGQPIILDGLTDIAQTPPPQPNGFTIEVFPVVFSPNTSSGIISNPFQSWAVVWIGIES